MASVSATTLVQTLRPLLKQAQLADLTTALQSHPANLEALARDLCQRGLLTPFQARQVLQGKGASLILGPYILLDLLGSGGAGHVFKARHRTMDRLVALKVLLPNLLADAEAVSRFFREIEVISQFAHPAIVHAYDAGVVGKSHYLAMEYVEGVDLERLVADQGPLPAAQACEFIRQAAEGLQYAHERGMVHRDIKPSNLLATRATSHHPHGSVKIMDLGLARLQEPVHGSRTKNLTVLAGAAVMQGTPDYMAPEQALDFHNASTRADIYSLGCTFHFLLTGQPPFGGSTLAEKLVRHQQSDPPALEALRADLPAELPAIVRTMMSKRPADRYATPGECAAAIAALLQQIGPTVSADTTAEMDLSQRTKASGLVTLPPIASPRRWVRRALWLLLPVVVLALLGGGAALTLWPPPALRTPERHEKPALYLTGDQHLPLPRDLLRKATTISVEAWFKTKNHGIILGYQRGPVPSGGGQHVPALYIGTDGLLRGMLWTEQMKPIMSMSSVNDDQWHHACLTADSAAKMQALYLDGKLVGTREGALVPLEMADNQLGTGLSPGWPGGQRGWHGFHGTLAEVRIWNRVLTPAEIEDQRPRALRGDEPGLVLYYPFDEAEGEAVVERVTGAASNVLRGNQKFPMPERAKTGPPVK